MTLLARALALDRVALLLEAAPGGELEPVAVHRVQRLASVAPGAQPGGGPWSLVMPIESGGRRIGLLLLDRTRGAPLAVVEHHLAEAVAVIAARLVEHGQTATELERARALLGQADRLSHLGMLAAGIAHEIRNPLVSVRTFIQLLPERLADEEFRTNFRELALSEIERICALLADILAFARPAQPEREATDLNTTIGQVVRLLDPEARRRNVALYSEVEGALPRVLADDAQVKQVLMNVVLNAIEACGTNGRVAIGTRRLVGESDVWAVVTVTDSGPGIATELVERIFDPFFTTKPTGNGLGLFIAREIVAGHAGHIAVGGAPGGGTEFAIHLPALEEARHAGVDAG